MAISDAVLEAAVAAETSGLRRLGEGSHALTRAAIGPAGIRVVLTRPADHLSGWVVLTDASGNRRRVPDGPVRAGAAGRLQLRGDECQEQATHIELQSVGGRYTTRSSAPAIPGVHQDR